jgi:C-terminal processing protease CtpA/Prc
MLNYVWNFASRNALASLRASALMVVCSVLLIACGGGGGGSSGDTTPPAPQPSGYPGTALACSVDGERAWLRDYMTDKYFWYNSQGVPNAASTSMYNYLQSLLYKPTDRYSYSQSTTEFTQLMVEGQRTGYGYSLFWADAAQTVIKVGLVEAQSPAGTAGLRRGDSVLSIDGLTVAQIAAGQLPSVTTTGVPRTITVARLPASPLQMTSALYQVSPVNVFSVFPTPTGNVGYLMYQAFLSTGATPLGFAFDLFRSQGIKELILDMRYNGGGSTLQARNLASMILDTTVASGKVFAHYRGNGKYPTDNFSQLFSTTLASSGVSTGLPATPLTGISRVFILTGGGTASASEMLINGLRPHMSVITIGTTTYGKPFAFLPISSCGTTYSAVNLEVANSLGNANYASGIPPTCPMSDDFDHPLGNQAERRTAAALSYIATGACPPIANTQDANLTASQSGQIQNISKKAALLQEQLDLNRGEFTRPMAVLD